MYLSEFVIAFTLGFPLGRELEAFRKYSRARNLKSNHVRFQQHFKTEIRGNVRLCS